MSGRGIPHTIPQTALVLVLSARTWSRAGSACRARTAFLAIATTYRTSRFSIQEIEQGGRREAAVGAYQEIGARKRAA